MLSANKQENLLFIIHAFFGNRSTHCFTCRMARAGLSNTL